MEPRHHALPTPMNLQPYANDTLRERRIYGVELLVSLTLNERLHPRILRLSVGQLPIEIGMCVTVDTIFRRSVRLPLVGIVESPRRQSSRHGFPNWIEDLLVSTIFVRRRGRPDHVSSTRLANPRGKKSRKDGDIQDIASVDEGACGGRWKLCKARNGLLRGDEGAVDVNRRVALQVGKRESERVIGWGEDPGADYVVSVSWRRYHWRRGLPL